MEHQETNPISTYFIKVRSCDKFPLFRNKFLSLLKSVEYITAIEVTKSNLCFYVETECPEDLEHFLSQMNDEFKRSKLGNIIYSKIHNVFVNKRKAL